MASERELLRAALLRYRCALLDVATLRHRCLPSFALHSLRSRRSAFESNFLTDSSLRLGFAKAHGSPLEVPTPNAGLFFGTDFAPAATPFTNTHSADVVIRLPPERVRQ